MVFTENVLSRRTFERKTDPAQSKNKGRGQNITRTSLWLHFNRFNSSGLLNILKKGGGGGQTEQLNEGKMGKTVFDVILKLSISHKDKELQAFFLSFLSFFLFLSFLSF